VNWLQTTILVSPDQLLRFALALCLALALGLGVALVYRYTHRGLNYESSFVSTLALLAPIVCLVMFFIQGDLVLSLGLVGSLSIIRFRTPIKDTRDMVYLFWSIVVGLGCGTMFWLYSILASLFIAVALVIFNLVKYGRQVHAEYILIIAGGLPADYASIEQLINQADALVQLRSHEMEGQTWERTYEFRFSRQQEQAIHHLATVLQQLPGIHKVSLLTPQLTLPM